MKRGREDKDEGSKPILGKEKRVLFGIDHTAVLHTIKEHDLSPRQSRRHSNEGGIFYTKSNEGIRSNRGKSDEHRLTKDNRTDPKTTENGVLISDISSTVVLKGTLTDRQGHNQRCEDLERLSRGLSDINKGHSDDDDDILWERTHPQRWQEETGHVTQLPQLDLSNQRDVSSTFEHPLGRTYTGSPQHSTEFLEDSIGQSHEFITTKANNLHRIHTAPDSIGSTEYTGQDLKPVDDLSSPFSSKVSRTLSSDASSACVYTSPTHSLSANNLLGIVYASDKEVLDVDSNVEEFNKSLPNFRTQRRLSLIELHTLSGNGVRVKTHIKLQRPKPTGTNSDELQDKSIRKSPANVLDTMKAFNGARTIRLSENEDCEAMSSSIPDISARRPSRVFKKLKAFVTSRNTKSMGELTKISSGDIAELNSKSLKDVDCTNEDAHALESSSESLTDDVTAAKAKQLLQSLDPLKSHSEIDDDDGTDSGNDVNSLNSYANNSHADDEKTSIIKAPPVKDYQRHNSLSVPTPNSVSQTLLRTDSVRKRVRTTSETNYSLLRPDMDDNLQGSSTVVFNRIPSIRQRRFQLLLHHHLDVTPDPDSPDDLPPLKDASHVNPVDNGDVIVTDILSNRLIVFDKTGTPTITFAMEPGSEPWATCLTPEGDLAVTLKRQGCVSMWSPSGEPISEFGQEYLSGPSGIQCDDKGRFIVADEESDEVIAFDKKGQMLKKLHGLKSSESKGTSVLSNSNKRPKSFSKPRYICLTPQGHYVISDSANHCLKIFDSSLKLIGQFGSYGRRDGQFKFPYGVASDEDGKLYIADHFNNRVSLFSKDGDFIEHLLTADDQITRPKGLAVKNGSMYITYGDLRANKVAVYKIRNV